jgi:hypothetical protein
MLVSSSDGFCREGLLGAILFSEALMVTTAVLVVEGWFVGRGQRDEDEDEIVNYSGKRWFWSKISKWELCRVCVRMGHQGFLLKAWHSHKEICVACYKCGANGLG